MCFPEEVIKIWTIKWRRQYNNEIIVKKIIRMTPQNVLPALLFLVLVLDIEIISEYIEDRLKIFDQLIIIFIFFFFFLTAVLVFRVVSLIQLLRFLLFRTVDQMGDFLVGFPHQLHILEHYSVAIAALDIRSSGVPDDHPGIVGRRKSGMLFKQEAHA
jgi:hypothetical protein